ncbi:MAG TPA: apolipoprotein N-acyltransferase [Acetobacteraceae bacterium]|nr:apolipoprotein N-acyltransferase [Acetobacteraceae bacterium]
MTWRPWRSDALRVMLAGVASALALPPLYLLPALLFIMPWLLRRLAQAGSAKRAAWLGWCFGFGLNVAGLYWITMPIMTEVGTFWWLVPFAAPLLAFAVAFYSIFPALAVYRMRPGLPMILVFAGVWVLSNLLQQFAFTGFPWNMWGADWTIPGRLGDVLIQPASVIGIHGLTLLTIILACLPLLGRRGWFGAAGMMLLWVGFGLARLAGPALADQNLTLGLIQPDFSVPMQWDRPALEARWQVDLDQTRQAIAAAGPGPKAIIWPETASPWLLARDAGARAMLAAVSGDIPVLAGTIRFAADGSPRNSFVVVQGPGPVLAHYDKFKLVPFGEYTPAWVPVKITPGGGFSPGPGPRTLHIPGLPPFDPLICYEAIFSGETIDNTDRPDWLVNITDDAWFGNSSGPRQDFATTRLRAVEEGVPLIRDANSGESAMIDSYGRVLASLPLLTKGVLVHKLPGALKATIYSRYGLKIPFALALVTLILGLIAARITRKRIEL